MHICGSVPCGIALFGIVILLNPIVPLCPVMVNDNVVTAAEGFVVSVMLEICELVMFPLIVR
jgi:hypothetical protein